MHPLIKELEEKKAQLQELNDRKSKANCVGEHSSGEDMNRMMLREELEEEIAELEKKVAAA